MARSGELVWVFLLEADAHSGRLGGTQGGEQSRGDRLSHLGAGRINTDATDGSKPGLLYLLLYGTVRLSVNGRCSPDCLLHDVSPRRRRRWTAFGWCAHGHETRPQKPLEDDGVISAGAGQGCRQCAGNLVEVSGSKGALGRADGDTPGGIGSAHDVVLDKLGDDAGEI